MRHDADIALNSAWIKADVCTGDRTTVSSNINELQIRLDELERKPDVDPAVKSTIDVRNKTLQATFYEDGFKKSTKTLIPDIKDVTVHANRVVIVEFVDGTTEKAVLHPDDSFSIEQGISICITKKLVGGSAIYNKLIERAIKIKRDNAAAKEKRAVEERERKERHKKYVAKKIERKAQKREDYINMHAEAMRRALITLGSNYKGDINHAD
jgi:hypothetical protein